MPDYLTQYRRTRHCGYIPGVMPLPSLPVTAGLVLWYDMSTEGYADSAAVSIIHDLSGNGYHAIQGTAARQPAFKTNILNGRAGLLGSDANSYYMTASNVNMAFGTSGSMYVVFSSPDAEYNVVWFEGAGDGYWRYGTDGKAYWAPFRAARINAAFVAPNDANAYIFTIISDAGANTYKTWKNAAGNVQTLVVNTTPNWGVSVNLTLFSRPAGNYNFGGYIHEVLLYSAAHGSTDMANTISYLNLKWGLG